MTTILRSPRWVPRGLTPALAAVLVAAGVGSAWAAPQDLPPAQGAPPAGPSLPAASAPGPAPAPTSAPQAASGGSNGTSSMQDMQMPPGGDTYPNLKIVGFGDVDYSDTKRPEGPQGFSEGQFVLHMISALSPRVSFFSELSFTARPDAGTGTPPAPGYNAEVERMILRFEKSDQLKVSFGRYHTPINYWNTAFHPGQWLEPELPGGSRQRPRVGHQPRGRRRRHQRQSRVTRQRLREARLGLRPRIRRVVLRRPHHDPDVRLEHRRTHRVGPCRVDPRGP